MLHTYFSNVSSHIAIYFEETSLTYQELFHKIQERCISFEAQGIKSGHRVAWLAKTTIDSLITFFALLEMGASPCPMSFRLAEEQVASYVSYAQSHFFLDLQTGVAKVCSNAATFQEQAILLFTSGSSGSPKLVSLKPHHFIANAQGALESLHLSQKSRWLLCVPLFHVSGLSILFRALLTGSSVAFTDNALNGDPLATHVSLVPTQLLRIVKQNTSFPSLRCALVGGAHISDNLVEMALLQNIPLYLTYGMSEMASQITMTREEDLLLPAHVGKALPGRSIRLAPDGEILVKGSSLFAGYDSPSGIRKPFDEEGFFATGDLGSLDSQGNLTHKGRKDNLFISGGENIYPEMIEQALGMIPGVLSSLVVPLEDLEFGQRPVAFVHMEGMMLSKEEFHEKLMSFLPKFCLPIHFLPFPQELEEKSFKLKRKELGSILPKLLAQKR